ncbi:hypothetical protein PSN45_004702 [Yamadazyma tenuis]|uniref:AN1-type domain-containing protein n=1 Tax=Candida tenuis (strain ATCC 10573 / BCRC 21748 / CBS 615 / JCM 9827 / NBRC 10315 / NRRL Y-1498 / VKM Y-70) TaxID=590646 RepID=G3B6V3_CANTC|nr:uncharacterized protein CANTEDRAFT_114335 [Yamadazyma tenuis ATCC 10573]EGV63031.1 hypothetical protein CANTEDRAFT_114335 [Yamadazyma tenuis ATCC 10573]WEJ97154.1 hypothetical protein PSN45_004702 [Yamadazyma tenuis]
MTNDLLLDRPQDDSIMDIGQNCSKCHQLDFLPFRCEYCKLVFCADHRRLQDHQCPHLQALESQNIRPRSPKRIPHGPTAASLFPDREKDRAKINSLIERPTKPTSILETSFRVGDVKSKTAFSKFAKFLNLQKNKRLTKSAKKIFAPKKPSPTVELQLLRKNAKGDAKIPDSDRVYVWCLHVNALEEEEDKLTKIDVHSQRVGIFVNKNWPIGRALDVISDELHIKNNNNKTTEVNERLNIFKVSDDQPVLLKTGDRCKDLRQGEVLYLVRGTV